MDEYEAKPHPFEVGECVEYIGRNSWQKGGGPMVRRGDVGVVIEVIPAGERGDEERRPRHGRSVVEFHGSERAREAVGGAWDYRRVDCK